MSQTFLNALQSMLGPGGVLTDAEDRAGYAGDLSVPLGSPFLAAVRPATTADTAAVLALCQRHGIVVTPRGGGSGLAGGATPNDPRPGIVLSLERMRAVRDIDTVGNTITLDAGVTLHAAQAAARGVNRMIGLDHGGAGSSQIGGNLSTNSGGNNVLRYGMARDQVLGIEAVLLDGSVLNLLQPLRKNNSGYDLKQLLLGSEGTIGIITAATLRLRPLPAQRATAFVGLERIEDVLTLLERTLSAFGETVSAFELLPCEALDFWFDHLGARKEPFSPLAPWHVLIEVDTTIAALDINAALTAFLGEMLEQGMVTDGAVAASHAQRAEFWKLREGIAIASIEAPAILKSDTAVPIRAIPAFIAQVRQAVDRVSPGARGMAFGHVGDGNIHFNVLPAPGEELASFNGRLEAIAAAIEDVAIALGGTVSAEHGIGSLKRAGLARMKPASDLALMRRIKRLFDPDNLLNPGKIF